MTLEKIKYLFLAVFLALNLATAAAALASTFDTVGSGFGKTGNEAGFAVEPGGVEPKVGFSQTFVNYINGMLGLMGALFMFLMLFAGYLWMTAFGKDEQVKRAKDLIIQAIIGIAVIITARLIAEIVITQLGKTLPGAS